VTDFDTELAFVRALSVHGLKQTSELSQEDRRERIRVAILIHKLEDQRFAIGPKHAIETYGQAFERCYHRPVEMRRMQRDTHHRPTRDATPLVLADDDERATRGGPQILTAQPPEGV
jgi:hypothetical protein